MGRINGYEFSDSSLLRKDGPYWYTENSELIFPMNFDVGTML